jgi:hypothetical protein
MKIITTSATKLVVLVIEKAGANFPQKKKARHPSFGTALALAFRRTPPFPLYKIRRGFPRSLDRNDGTYGNPA